MFRREDPHHKASRACRGHHSAALSRHSLISFVSTLYLCAYAGARARSAQTAPADVADAAPSPCLGLQSPLLGPAEPAPFPSRGSRKALPNMAVHTPLLIWQSTTPLPNMAVHKGLQCTPDATYVYGLIFPLINLIIFECVPRAARVGSHAANAPTRAQPHAPPCE